MLSVRRKRKEEAGLVLPLVALLDVIFFMLLYFMAAGTLAPADAELASAIAADKKGAGKGTDLQSQILFVERDQGKVRFRLGDRAMKDKGEAGVVLARLPKEPGIIVKAMDDVSVADAAAALQACRDAGFTRVSYVAGK